MTIEAWMDGHKYDEFDAEQVRKSFEKFKAEHPENFADIPLQACGCSPSEDTCDRAKRLFLESQNQKLAQQTQREAKYTDGEVDLIEESRKVMDLMMMNGFREPSECCCCEPDKTVNELFKKLDDPYERAKIQEGKTMDPYVKNHTELCKELNTIFEKKNEAYGSSFFDTFYEEGWAMPRIRLTDKLNRFKTLSRNLESMKDDELALKIDAYDESIRDTLLDLANYALMSILAMEDEKMMFRASKEE